MTCGASFAPQAGETLDLTPLEIVKAFVSRPVAALFALIAFSACSNGSPSGRRERISANAKTDDSAAGTVDVGGSAVFRRSCHRTGTVSGTVRLDGNPPIDTTTITRDQKICGTGAPGRIAAVSADWPTSLSGSRM